MKREDRHEAIREAATELLRNNALTIGTEQEFSDLMLKIEEAAFQMAKKVFASAGEALQDKVKPPERPGVPHMAMVYLLCFQQAYTEELVAMVLRGSGRFAVVNLETGELVDGDKDPSVVRDITRALMDELRPMAREMAELTVGRRPEPQVNASGGQS